MAILKLTDASTREALKHPLLKNKMRIGRGAFCVVFDNGNSVFKLTCDPFQYLFYTHKDRPQGAYFPTLLQDFGVVGGSNIQPLYLLEMEKLDAFKRKAFSHPEAWEERKSLLKLLEFHRQKIWNQFDGDDERMKTLIACLRGTREYHFLKPDLQQACEQVADFCELIGCEPDLHRHNFMFRGSQLIFNDVVKDQHEVYRRSLLAFMPPEAVAAYLEQRRHRRKADNDRQPSANFAHS